MRKLRQTTGESIAETLVAVLIITFAFLILAGAVTTAANVNHRADNDDQSVKLASSGQETNIGLQFYVDGAAVSGIGGTAKATLYSDENGTNGYSYYEYKR